MSTFSNSVLRGSRVCSLALAVWFLNGSAPVMAAERLVKPTGTARWEAEIQSFEQSDRTHPPPQGAILFVGSSSIRLWKSLARDFPDLPVINRGFGGSQLVDSTYFADRIVTPYHPRQIVVYAGANDISAGKTPLQVLGDFRAFAAKVHTALPQTRIAFLAVAGNPARWSQIERVKAANDLIRKDCEKDPRLDYIDVFTPMMAEDGHPKPGIFVQDRLHMNEKGYAIWTRVIRPYLK
jgi:lysophospholipase L1-like esterase